jgi:DNA mismatch endonuclease, patch repair protein
MDTVSAEDRSRMMRAIRSKDMKPELAVRRLAHIMGYRYRLHRHDLPGRPDMVFLRRRKIIFVHGCFWHQHGSPSCPLIHTPSSNVVYWQPKLQRNKARDAANADRLKAAGWGVLVIWECELKDPRAVAKALKRFLGRTTAKPANLR